jgi:hypothetical protein
MSSYRTEEFQITNEDRLVITWDAEKRTIETFTRGTTESLYCGYCLTEAAESLELTRDDIDQCLMSDPIVRDAQGQIVE